MATQKRAFAAVVQAIIIGLLLLSMVLIGQRMSLQIYQIGLLLLVASTLSQIAFGNIPPNSNFGKSMRMYVTFMAVTAAIFVISIFVAPLLVSLGR